MRFALLDAWDRYGRDPDTVLVHGACPTGADAIADQVWRAWGLPVETHPADWSKGKTAGPRRNKAMVDLGADICLAFPLKNSRGTKNCMKLATNAGITVQSFQKLEGLQQYLFLEPEPPRITS